MVGSARSVIRALGLVTLALALGIGPVLAELCETRCAHPASGGGHAHVHHAACPDVDGGAPVLASVPAAHVCQTRDVNAAMSRQLDRSSTLAVVSVPGPGHATLDRVVRRLSIEGGHGPRGSPSTRAPLRI